MTYSIYLDSNATTPVLPDAAQAALHAMSAQFGNPSSPHTQGIVARALLDQTRQRAQAMLGAGDGQVLFTSGATEGIQTALLSALCAIAQQRHQGRQSKNLLVYGATEHKAVPQALTHWNQILGLNLEIRALPVDSNGHHDLATLAQWLPDTALLCTMAANNETGVITQLDAIEALLRQAAHRVLWMVDCVQALGKLALNLHATLIDYAPFSGHKLYAPKGIGMLYVRRGAPFTPLMVGGGQEDGLRSGTENMPGIAALGAVLHALQRGDTFASDDTLQGWRLRLIQSLRRAFPHVVFNAPLACSLPSTLNFSVPGLSSKTILDLFDAAGLRASGGSACSAAKAKPSDVLQAMGLPEWQTESAVRLSIGPLTPPSVVDAACKAIEHCGEVLRQCESQREGLREGPRDNLHPTAADAACGAATDTAHHAANDPATWTLHWSELDDYLQRHPHATLIDLREPMEHLASGGIQYGAHRAVNRPSSTLTQASAVYAGQAVQPLVLVCRSGARSLRIAAWLQSLGHRDVRHVHGGLALRP